MQNNQVIQSPITDTTCDQPISLDGDCLCHKSGDAKMSMSWVSIGSDNCLLPVYCHVNAWTDVDLQPIEPLATIFSEILLQIQKFSLHKTHLKMSSAKCQPFFRPQCTKCITMKLSQTPLLALHVVKPSDSTRLPLCHKQTVLWKLVHIKWHFYGLLCFHESNHGLPI